MRADCLHVGDAEMPAATTLMEATPSSRGAPSGGEAASPPKALLRGVAALVAAVEELEARTRLPFVPHGAASVLLVRLFSLDPAFLACVRELDDAREAAGIDSRDPRWALDTAEALWALDRLLRDPAADAREILGTSERLASAIMGLAEDRLRRGKGDARALLRALRRLHSLGAEAPPPASLRGSAGAIRSATGTPEWILLRPLWRVPQPAPRKGGGEARSGGLGDVPDCLDRLAGWLGSRGFRHHGTADGDQAGERVHFFQRGGLRVRFVLAEEDWRIELTYRRFGNRWFDADLVRIYVALWEARPQPGRIESQATFLHEGIQEVAISFSKEPFALECLDALQAMRGR